MVMKMNNLSNAAFADKIGVQRSSISHVIAGRNRPSLDFLEKTLKAFPRVDAHWLITGEQSKLKTEHGSEEIEEEQELSSTPAKQSQANIEAPPQKEAPHTTREVKKIIVFYTDGTYDETYPKT